MIDWSREEGQGRQHEPEQKEDIFNVQCKKISLSIIPSYISYVEEYVLYEESCTV